jgi:hypothetical protein
LLLLGARLDHLQFANELLYKTVHGERTLKLFSNCA